MMENYGTYDTLHHLVCPSESVKQATAQAGMEAVSN
jgi:hypothetical protein